MGRESPVKPSGSPIAASDRREERTGMRFDDRAFPDDWSAHRLHPTSNGLLYIADAAARAGSILTHPWDPTERLADAGAPRPSRIPEPELAFDGLGRPVEPMNARFAMLVRRHAATGGFDPDPVADIDPTPVSVEDWEEAYLAAEEARSSREAARTVAGVVAYVLAQAADGHVATFERAMSGTVVAEMPKEAWILDEPLRRLAACAFNKARPNDPTAVPDHYVFIDPRGFDAAIKAYLPSHFRYLISELRGEAPPGASTYEDLIGRVTQALLDAVMGDRQRQWRRPDLKEALGDDFGNLEDAIFEKARTRVERLVGPLAKRGRPRAV